MKWVGWFFRRKAIDTFDPQWELVGRALGWHATDGLAGEDELDDDRAGEAGEIRVDRDGRGRDAVAHARAIGGSRDQRIGPVPGLEERRAIESPGRDVDPGEDYGVGVYELVADQECRHVRTCVARVHRAARQGGSAGVGRLRAILTACLHVADEDGRSVLDGPRVVTARGKKRQGRRAPQDPPTAHRAPLRGIPRSSSPRVKTPTTPTLLAPLGAAMPCRGHPGCNVRRQQMASGGGRRRRWPTRTDAPGARSARGGARGARFWGARKRRSWRTPARARQGLLDGRVERARAGAREAPAADAGGWSTAHPHAFLRPVFLFIPLEILEVRCALGGPRGRGRGAWRAWRPAALPRHEDRW